MHRRALVVGVDHYSSFRGLTGCVNDAKAIAPLLARHEDDSPNFSARMLTTSAGSTLVQRDQLLVALDDLFGPGAEMSLLYFAGHGVLSASGDVSLATSDGTRQTPGVRFTEVLERIGGCQHEVAVVLDCCFSGAAGGVPATLRDAAVLRQGVSIVTASRADQVAAETHHARGQFSTFLEGALEGGAADVVGQVTLAGLYAYLSEAFGDWDQRPMLKANVDRLQVIRRCGPAVPLPTLRQLAHWFPTADYVFPLDPSFEPDKRDSGLDPHPENEAIFGQLQRCANSKLIEPVGAEHMYFAAMQNEGCRLTPLGRRYRYLAADGRL